MANLDPKGISITKVKSEGYTNGNNKRQAIWEINMSMEPYNWLLGKFRQFTITSTGGTESSRWSALESICAAHS